MKKGFLGIVITVGTYLLLILIHALLGGDKGQSGRSDWFPLIYIIPVMAGLLTYFIVKDKGDGV